MKYHHPFTVAEENGHYRIYQSGEKKIRLDFFSHILRVSIYEKEEDLFPTFTVCPGETKMPYTGRNRLSQEGLNLTTPTIEKEDGKEIISLEDVKVSIELMNFRMHYHTNGKLLFEDRDYISYNFEEELGKGSYHFISREEDEQIFGLGDKSGDVNKNKRQYRMETMDAMGYDARSSDPLYKQLPFYICHNSVGSYGIYYDTYSNGSFDFGKEINNYYQPFKSFRCEEESLVFYVIFGTTEEILHRFSYLCGKNFFPPKWSLKYCGSTMAYTDAPDADFQLRRFVSLCQEYGIDCGGFYLSSGYTQIGEKRYVFHWNRDKFRDPKDTAEYFRKNGIEFLPNVKPVLLTDHFLYGEFARHGWFLHYKDGTPAVFPFWSGMGSYIDFTNRDAFDFWTKCVKENLVDLGYRNIWNDNNEYDIHDENVYAAGFGKPIQAKRIRPLFPLLMTMASIEAQDKSKRIMSVTRSGPGGLQRIAETWTGDNHTSFAELRYNHKIAMTMSLSGFYNFGQDIGGFAGPCPNRELFLRWLQYGVFTPRFTLHSWNSDGSSTMPWLYEDEITTVKQIFGFRSRMLPYLYQNLYRSVTSYSPIIFPVFLKHPEYDPESDCFFFGEDILACPQFDEGKEEVQVTLPSNNGDWYYQNKPYSGTVTMKTPLRGLPVFFIRGGSLIPEEINGKTIFTLYPKREGEFDSVYLKDDGVSYPTKENSELIRMHVLSTVDSVLIQIHSKERLEIRFVDALNRELQIQYLD